jgi:prophage antirepressor-like protein
VSEFLTLMFEGKELRVMVLGNKLWFHGGDVCAALEIGDARRALTALDDEKKRIVEMGWPSKDETVIHDFATAHMARDRHTLVAKRFLDWFVEEICMAMLLLRKLASNPANALEALTAEQEAVCRDMRQYITHESALRQFESALHRKQEDVDRLRRILKTA